MTILSIFVCLLSVLSCGSDNEETEVAIIDVSPAQLSATHEGLVTSATINSGLEWTAFSDDACKDWISCKITDNGSQGTVEVTVQPDRNRRPIRTLPCPKDTDWCGTKSSTKELNPISTNGIMKQEKTDGEIMNCSIM